MRVLLVALHFPPENVIASLRTGHIAAGLAELGEEVVVATRVPPEGGLGLRGLEDVQVISASDGSERWRRRVDQSLDYAAAPRRARWSARTRLRRLLKAMSRAIPPDRHVGWAFRLLRRLRDLPAPDVVLVSVPPLSALLVAATMARRHGVPLVVDYRDSLVQDPYNELAYPLRLLRRGCERVLTRRADHVTSVSQPLVDELSTSLAVPGTVVMNGFDPADFDGLVGTGADDESLVVTFCGYLHEGKRDPGPLFEAMAIARDRGHAVHARFFGPNTQVLEPMVRQWGLQELVTLAPKVDHARSIELQRHSDVLLQLSRHDAADRAVMSGKIFEYIGAARPILLVGYEHGVAADLLRQHDLGIASTRADEIAQALVSWSRQKRDNGGISPLDTVGLEMFTRRHQNRVLHEVLRGVVGTSA